MVLFLDFFLEQRHTTTTMMMIRTTAPAVMPIMSAKLLPGSTP